MFAGIHSPPLDAFANVLCRFFPKARQFGHFSVLARRFQLFNSLNPKLVVERLYFPRTDPRNLQHL